MSWHSTDTGLFLLYYPVQNRGHQLQLILPLHWAKRQHGKRHRLRRVLQCPHAPRDGHPRDLHKGHGAERECTGDGQEHKHSPDQGLQAVSALDDVGRAVESGLAAEGADV